MPDSLFGSDSDSDGSYEDEPPIQPIAHVVAAASSSPPPIPGLYLFRGALPVELQHQLTEALSEDVWQNQTNQVMLFDSPTRTSLPPYLQPLLDLLPSILAPLPEAVIDDVFSTARPRQAILNLYFPGQGISPHVDLPTRYSDGIVGISLLGSTVMDFLPASALPGRPGSGYSLRLRPGDVYVLSGEARWEWTHGIAYREEDWVQDERGEVVRVRRGIRMSITLRRMLEGAELVGGDEEVAAPATV
ncbi:hypothetical protein JCM10213_001511 [Rhodosporidiobolus nylandii]